MNLFEIIICVLGGFFSVYYLRGGGVSKGWGVVGKVYIVGLDLEVYLDCVKDLGDCLMFVFINSKLVVFYSDVFLKERIVCCVGDFSGVVSIVEVIFV